VLPYSKNLEVIPIFATNLCAKIGKPLSIPLENMLRMPHLTRLETEMHIKLRVRGRDDNKPR